MLLLLAAPLSGQALQPGAQLLFANSGVGSVSALDQPARLVVDDLPLAEALSRLANASGIPIAFSPSQVAKSGLRVGCDCGSVPVRDALDRMLRDAPFRYSEAQDQVVLYPTAPRTRSARQGVVSVPRATAVAASARTVRTGTITGVVTDRTTTAPIQGAQVFLPSTGAGTLTRQDGRFILPGVPDGTHSVRVMRIGFALATQQVEVRNGVTTEVNFALDPEVLGLDEVVVTGTAGGVQRRAVGNVVGSLDTERALEVRAPPSIQQMLGGQVPGVAVQVGGGNVGTGGNVLIRGVSTLSLSTTPLVYIDGVRANGQMLGLNAGVGTNRLNDINPEDIERIEIIKGPAAATLYGTEASNGVIQIITKKGRSGVPTVEVVSRQGANWFHDPAGRLEPNYGLSPDRTTIISQHLYEDEIAAGREMFRTGRVQSYGLNVRGGQDRLVYFLSANRDDEEGFMRNNGLQRTTVRSNLGINITDKLDVSADIGVIRSEATFAPDGTAGTTGLFSMLLWGTPSTRETPSRGFMVGPPEYQDMIDMREQLHRATASVTANYATTDWLKQRVVVGFDWTDAQRSIFHPRLPAGTPAFFGANSAGSKSLTYDRDLQQTLDYGATASFDVNSSFTSATSVGVQYFAGANRSSNATGNQLPTPAVSTVSSAAVRTGTEQYVENKTFGAFVQQMVGWKNQAFLTAALRADANSAFGESFKAAYYPKLSGTWVVSDADFWNVPLVESFRLRGAWGKSGLQPQAFAAIRTWAPTTGPGDVPALTPGTIGNPDLRPEVGQELEVGFEASLLDTRLTVDFTHYRQTTKDAILQERVAPSGGFAGSRFVNAGEVSNQGYELKVEGRPVATPTIALDLMGSISYNRNRLEDLGGRPPIQADTRGRFQHREGYPLGGYWSKYVVSAEWGPNRTLANVTCKGPEEQGFAPMPCAQAPFHYVGPPGPTWQGSFGNTLTLGNRLTLNALWVFVGDSRRFNTTEWYRDRTQRNSERAQQFLLGTLDAMTAATITVADVEHFWMERDDYVKLREVSASYNLPSAWAQRVGASRASVMLSGRNLFTWAHPEFRKSGLDPEVRRQREVPWGWQQTQAPIPHSVVATLRMTF